MTLPRHGVVCLRVAHGGLPSRSATGWRRTDSSARRPTAREPAPVPRPADGPANRRRGPFDDAAALARRVAFWFAVVLPAVYVPLLVAPGAFSGVLALQPTLSAGGVTVALAALDLLAVVLGHAHGRT